MEEIGYSMYRAATGPRYIEPKVMGAATRSGQMRMAYADPGAVEWSLANVLLGSPVADDSRRRLIADALQLSAPATAGWIDVGTREDFAEAVANIDVPVAIVAGELDRVDPVQVVKDHVIARYPSAQVSFLADKGHLLPVEAPEEVAVILEKFAGAL